LLVHFYSSSATVYAAVAQLFSLGGKRAFMILYRHPRHSRSGWTIFEVFFFTLAAGLAAYLVSSCFSSSSRGVVFSICFVAFFFAFWLLFFLCILPAIVRHQKSKRDKQR
jgi:hypothetical protein